MVVLTRRATLGGGARAAEVVVLTVGLLAQEVLMLLASQTPLSNWSPSFSVWSSPQALRVLPALPLSLQRLSLPLQYIISMDSGL